MKIEYRVIYVEDPDDSSEPYNAVVRLEDGMQKEVIGYDGGEPEDQTLNRDWQWVPKAIWDGYILGYDHGYEAGQNNIIKNTY